MSEVESGNESTPSAPDFGGADQPAYARTLFLGPDGLRPGWGVVFYFAMYYLLKMMVVELAWARNLGPSGLWSEFVGEFGLFVAAAIPSVILARVERRHWGRYGLPVRKALGKLFWIGGMWGIAALTVLLLLMRGLHIFDFGHLALHGVRIAKLAVFWGAMFLLVGLFEEFLMRGYSQFTLARGVGFWPAALALSSAFALMHLDNEGEQLPGLLAVVCIGLFFCFTLRRTGNLWFAVGFHAAWDWGQTFLYSVPDSGTVWPGHLLRSSLKGPAWLSGGTVGPEGSVLSFAVIGLTWLAFGRAYPKKADADL